MNEKREDKKEKTTKTFNLQGDDLRNTHTRTHTHTECKNG